MTASLGGSNVASISYNVGSSWTLVTTNLTGVDSVDFGYSMLYLLDDVSTGAVPEPASWALMIVGFGMVGASLRRRKAALAA